ARRRRIDRLPCLQRVDRTARTRSGHSRVLLRAAATLGLGRLAREENAPHRGPCALQFTVRTGMVRRTRRRGSLRRASLLRRTAAAEARRPLPRTAAGYRRANRRPPAWLAHTRSHAEPSDHGARSRAPS